MHILQIQAQKSNITLNAITGITGYKDRLWLTDWLTLYFLFFFSLFTFVHNTAHIVWPWSFLFSYFFKWLCVCVCPLCASTCVTSSPCASCAKCSVLFRVETWTVHLVTCTQRVSVCKLRICVCVRVKDVELHCECGCVRLTLGLQICTHECVSIIECFFRTHTSTTGNVCELREKGRKRTYKFSHTLCEPERGMIEWTGDTCKWIKRADTHTPIDNATHWALLFDVRSWWVDLWQLFVRTNSDTSHKSCLLTQEMDWLIEYKSHSQVGRE